jgi:glutaredoxin
MTTVRRVLPLALAGLALAWSMGATAQVYRIVGPDGRVTFSDKPPTDPGTRASPAPTVAMPGGAGTGGALPFELRSITTRYPVTLYTGSSCGPCDSARIYLTSRGVPFSERTVSTNDDVAALRRLSGENRLPFLTIGTQQLQGFSETEWTQFLDAAGYPRTSRLPAGYRNPPAAPLVAVQQPSVLVPAPTAIAEPPSQAEAPAPSAPAPANPAGIRF